LAVCSLRSCSYDTSIAFRYPIAARDGLRKVVCGMRLLDAFDRTRAAIA
jgi:hypothetical protein